MASLGADMVVHPGVVLLINPPEVGDLLPHHALAAGDARQRPLFAVLVFSFDNGGKPPVNETTVQRGFRTIYANRDSKVGDTLYPASECSAAIAAATAAEELEKPERQQFDLRAANKRFSTVAERFTAKHRREQPFFNGYNAIIQFFSTEYEILRDSNSKYSSSSI